MEVVNVAFTGDDGMTIITDNVPPSTVEVMELKTQIADYSTARKGPLIGAALAAAFSGFILGRSLGWASPVQTQLQPIAHTNIYANATALLTIWNIRLDDDQMSWVGSLLNIGAIFGALCGGFLMDRFGRRFVLMTMSTPFTIGWLIITLAVDSNMLYVGRIILGYSGGVCSAIAPCYIGEISTPTMRGIVGFFFTLNIVCGFLATSLMGLWMHWRWISLVCTIEPIILLVSLIFVPESPYYLFKKGRQHDACRALSWLRGSNYNIKSELCQIEARVQEDAKESYQISDLFQPWVLKPILIGIALMILQQFSGLNAFLFNAAEIFRVAEFKYNRLIGVVFLNAVQVSTVVFSSLVLVKKFNRRVLFVIIEGLACLSMLSMDLFFFHLDPSNPQKMTNFTWIPLTSMTVFSAACGLGLGALPWLISSEILPPRFRGPGSSIIAFTNFTVSFIATKTFLDMQRVMTHAGVFWFYGGVAFIGILFGLFLLPETKDRTSDQIQAGFRT